VEVVVPVRAVGTGREELSALLEAVCADLPSVAVVKAPPEGGLAHDVNTVSLIFEAIPAVTALVGALGDVWRRHLRAKQPQSRPLVVIETDAADVRVEGTNQAESLPPLTHIVAIRLTAG
jgi:hypothetical protein